MRPPRLVRPFLAGLVSAAVLALISVATALADSGGSPFPAPG